MEAILRQADASLEKWFRAAKKRAAGIVRQRVDNLQGGLKKLSTGLEQVERERPVAQSEEPAKEKNVAPSKRRARPAVAPKPSASRKRKKAA
jgi:hypothetical protein